jgi:flavin-dependent dehydrogenase
MTYDVLIAGASFAGLALASRLRGRVLVVDQHPPGTHPTSACGAPLRLLRAMGAEEAIQQVHDRIVIHTTYRTYRWDLGHVPFCTFDYRAFCEGALARTGAEFLQAVVSGLDGNGVRTSRGSYRARLVADCTGWRAVLASSVVPSWPTRPWRAFGIETEVQSGFEAGLHFYFWPDVAPDGYAWAFPCGDRVRLGVLSYRGKTKLRRDLHRFAERLGLRPAGYHGGYLGIGLVDPVVGDVFVVGDAAGHCLPLTGEGIRSAVHAGWLVGDLFCGVLEGRWTLGWAKHAYSTYVARQRRSVEFLMMATRAALRLPPVWFDRVVRAFSTPCGQRAFLSRYLATFPPSGPGLGDWYTGV